MFSGMKIIRTFTQINIEEFTITHSFILNYFSGTKCKIYSEYVCV